MSDTTERQAGRGARFSLLTLAWLLTVAALAVGLFSSKLRNDKLAMRNMELRAKNDAIATENQALRSKLGLFEIEDPTKIHAIRVPTEDDEPRTYRIYLPPGRKYLACYQANRIPKRGVGEHPNPTVLESGTYLLKVKINRRFDRETGQPIKSVTVDFDIDAADERANSSQSAKIGISEMWNNWIVNKETGGMSYGWQDIDDKLQLHEPTEPMLVYRARAHEIVVLSRDSDGEPDSYTTKGIDGQTDGFMVWIEPQPEEGNEPK